MTPGRMATSAAGNNRGVVLVGTCQAVHPELGRCGGVAGHPALPGMTPSREHGSSQGWWNEETGYWQEWWQPWRPNPRSRWFPNGRTDGPT
jgi:hypothetical protein